MPKPFNKKQRESHARSFTKFSEDKPPVYQGADCPRCGSGHAMNEGFKNEFSCRVCGYAAYASGPSSDGKSRGPVTVVRYSGPAARMADMLLFLMPGKAAKALSPYCPFDGLEMDKNSVVKGKAQTIMAERRLVSRDAYLCANRHRIFLEEDANGDLGWS